MRRGRKTQPTAAAIDRQFVKAAECGGPCGYDGGNKISGGKRQTLVDTEGDLLKVRCMLLPAGVRLRFPAIQLVWTDTHHQGLKTWIKA